MRQKTRGCMQLRSPTRYNSPGAPQRGACAFWKTAHKCCKRLYYGPTVSYPYREQGARATDDLALRMRAVPPALRRLLKPHGARGHQGRRCSWWPLERVHAPKIVRAQRRFWCAQYVVSASASFLTRVGKRNGPLHLVASQDGGHISGHWHRAEPAHEAVAGSTRAEFVSWRLSAARGECHQRQRPVSCLRKSTAQIRCRLLCEHG